MARDFIAAGAYGLALKLVDANQPDYMKAPQTWLAWERVRIAALQQQRSWAAIVALQHDLPQGISFAQRADFGAAAVRAELAQGHGEGARKLLRSLLWDGRHLPDAKQLRTWRRLVIESYLDSNRLDDARLALLNYQLDYTSESDAERAVLARVWLRVSEPRHALELLSRKVRPDTNWLYWLAALRTNTMSAATVYKQALKATADKTLEPSQLAQLWGVAVSAAKQQGNLTAEISALEHFLSLAPSVPLTPLLPFDGDTLWSAYRALAMQAGNRGRLLVGDDSAWENAARKALKTHHAVLSRAYNALLSKVGQTAEGRAMGYRWLGTALLSLPQGKRLLDRLFLNAPAEFPRTGDIPLAIRLVLANDAVDRGDLTLAARLMVGLDKAPAGEDPYLWTLRLARVLVLGGKLQAGVARLQHLIADQPSFDRTQADQLMQVLFDLQSLRKNRLALTLFESVYPKLQQTQQKREVLFWQAQSQEALGNEALAAQLYLQSALLNGANTYGPWGSTARYNAGMALSKAGMVADARRVLQDLLAHTQDAARQSVLRQKLADIARLPAASETPSSTDPARIAPAPKS